MTGLLWQHHVGRKHHAYHTPHVVSQTGSGLAEDLIKLAGPTVVGALERGVEGVQQGRRAVQAFGGEAKRTMRELKRKAPAMAVRALAHKRGRLTTIFD